MEEQTKRRPYEIWVPLGGYYGEDTSWILESTAQNLEEIEESWKDRVKKYRGAGKEIHELYLSSKRLDEDEIALLANKSYALIINESGDIWEEGTLVENHLILLKENKSDLAKIVETYLGSVGPGHRDKLRIARSFDLTKVSIRKALRDLELKG